MVGVNPEKDRAQVVAKVNGEPILKGEVLDRLEREKALHGLTDESLNDEGNKEYVLEMKKSVLEQMITEKLLNQKTTEAGFVVTDELRQEAREEWEEIKKEVEEGLKEAGEEGQTGEGEEGAEPEERDYAKEAQEYLDGQLKSLGMSQEEYIEFIAEQKTIDKLYEKTVGHITVEESDIEEYYSEELEKQKENIALTQGKPVVLYEAPQVKVRHVLVEIPAGNIAEYQKLMDDKKEDEAKKFLDKQLQVIKGKADSVFKKAQEQDDFMALVEEENPDAAEAMKEGLTFNEENPHLPKEYLEAAFKLSAGEVSDPIATPFGYYIIKLDEKIPEKTHTLEEKKEDIKAYLDRQKQDEEWREILEDWKKSSVKKFERRL